METVSDPAFKLDDRFTYGQYKNWPEDQRWELIDGEAWAMSSSGTRHQELVGRLHVRFRTFLEGLAIDMSALFTGLE
jgi:hypothetical protein